MRDMNRRNRAPGYLGNYTGGMGLTMPTIAPGFTVPTPTAVLAPMYAAKETSASAVAPATSDLRLATQQSLTVSPVSAAVNRAHIDQVKLAYCGALRTNSTADATAIVRRQALEVWGWAPDYANRAIATATADIARAATSDFDPYSGCRDVRPMAKLIPTPTSPTLTLAPRPAPSAPSLPSQQQAELAAQRERAAAATAAANARSAAEAAAANARAAAAEAELQRLRSLPPPPPALWTPAPGLPTRIPSREAQDRVPTWAWFGGGALLLIGAYLVSQRPRKNPRRRRRRR